MKRPCNVGPVPEVDLAKLQRAFVAHIRSEDEPFLFGKYKELSGNYNDFCLSVSVPPAPTTLSIAELMLLIFVWVYPSIACLFEFMRACAF